MKYTINNIDKTNLEIEFTTTKQEYEEASERAYERTKNKYDIQGFRKGKVPKRVIERTYGEGVFFEDAFADLADQAYALVMTEHPEIHPFKDPSLELVSFVEGVLKAKIVMHVIPEPELGAYKGLEVKAIINEFDPSQVDAELKHAQMHHTHLHPVDKVSENGDVVVIDFVGSTDGVEFEGGKATDYSLELGSHSFIDTFEDQLVGHKAGDHVTVNVRFPDDYGAPALAGKEAVFECDIKSVNQKHVPEINDELAKHVADFDTLEEWKKDIEAQIRHEIDHRNRTIMEDAIIAKVIDNSKIDLPKEYVEEQLDAIMRDLTQRLAYQGMRIEDYANYIGTTVEKLRDERRDDAERIGKTKQVLEAIVRAEKMTVSDEEMDAKIAEFAKMANKSTEDYKKSMDSRRLDYLYSDILMEKLMNFLMENNKVIAQTDGEGADKKKPAKKEAKSSATKADKPAEKKTTKTATKSTTKTAEKTADKETKTTTKSTAKTTKTAEKKTTKTAVKTAEKKTTKTAEKKKTA